MKQLPKIFKPIILFSICSLDKTGKLIRLSSWNNAPDRVTAGFQPVIDGNYGYGWKSFNEILIVNDRLKAAAPVDVYFAINDLVIQDLKDKQDIIDKSYIVEYSLQHIYKPYTREQIKSMSKAQEMRNLISSKLNDIPISHLSQMIQLLNPK